MTTLYVGIKYAPNTIDVSSKLIQRLEIWRKATEGIGRFTLFIDNKDGQYNGVFSADDPVEIKINNVVFLRGYIDIIQPVSADKSGIYQQTMRITGRDYGQDLTNKLIDKIYEKKPADDIIADMLSSAGSEISFTSPSAAPEIQYSAVGEYLNSALRKILEVINWDGYVDEDKNWQMFEIGSVPSGITLKSVAGAADNNILNLIKDEVDALELRNYLIVRGKGRIADEFSEGNADDWTVGDAGNVIDDEFNTVKKGAASIEVGYGTQSSGDLFASLIFPIFGLNYLDFREVSSDSLSVLLNVVITGLIYKTTAKIRLKDDENNEIEFITEENVERNIWNNVSVPIGINVEIADNLRFQGWYYTTKITTFNWKITQLSVGTVPKGSPLSDFTMFIDGLNMPTRMQVISEDAASEAAYKTRQLIVNRPEVQSYHEMKKFADSELDKRKNPFARLKIKALGTAGIISNENKWVPGYTAIINSPGDNLNNIVYRMLTIHQVIMETPDESEHDFITELTFVPQNEPVETKRLSFVDNSDVGLLRELHDRIKYLEEKEERQKDWWPPLPKPLSIQDETDRYFVLEGTYANRPAAGVKGRIYYATDLQWFYYDNGVSWEFYSSAAMRTENPSLIPNFSFEYDEDGDGIPDNWSFNPATGTPTSGISSTERRHGLKSAFITALTTEWGELKPAKIEVLEGRRYVYNLLAKSDVAQTGGLVFCINWYDKDDAFISQNCQFTDSGTSWSLFQLQAMAPTGAAKAQLSLENKTPSVDCTIYFDYVDFHEVKILDGSAFPSDPYEGQIFIKSNIAYIYRNAVWKKIDVMDMDAIDSGTLYEKILKSHTVGETPYIQDLQQLKDYIVSTTKIATNVGTRGGGPKEKDDQTTEYTEVVPASTDSGYVEKLKWLYPAVPNMKWVVKQGTCEAKTEFASQGQVRIECSHNGVDWTILDTQNVASSSWTALTLSGSYTSPSFGDPLYLRWLIRLNNPLGLSQYIKMRKPVVTEQYTEGQRDTI